MENLKKVIKGGKINHTDFGSKTARCFISNLLCTLAIYYIFYKTFRQAYVEFRLPDLPVKTKNPMMQHVAYIHYQSRQQALCS